MDKYFSNRFFRITSSVMVRWLTVISLLLLPVFGHAQCTDRNTMGTDFWLMFLKNIGNDQSECSLTAAFSRSTVIHVNNPVTHWDTTVYTTSSGNVKIPIPYGSAVGCSGGIHVTSTYPIALYASNHLNHSYDIATIYPTSTLRTRYMPQTYHEFMEEEVGYVAVEDSTTITMVLPRQVNDDMSAGTYSITLMSGETYLLEGVNLSGIKVTSNGKPFGMFQGSVCTPVGGCPACDHLYEQSYPVDYWGNHFMLVSTATRSSGDLVLITSLEDSCSLYIDTTFLTFLGAGETYHYNLPGSTEHILQSTKPVTVCVYLKGYVCDGLNGNGDPAAVIIPPVEQGVASTIFQAVNTVTTTAHFANIVTPNYAVPYMKLDGVSISSNFTQTPYDYAYSRLSVSPGSHYLGCDSGSFVAWFYGLGYAESYAYIAGSSILDLSEKLYVDGHYTRTYTGSFDYCQGDTVPMWIESDEEGLLTDWLIDSSSLSVSDSGFKYVFNIPGDHLVQAVVHICDTLSAIIHVHPRINLTYNDTTCFDHPFHWQGSLYDSTGIYRDTLPNLYGCDTLLTLKLCVIPRPTVSVLSEVDCHEASYSLSADLTEVERCPFSWSSIPHDPWLDGHEHDTLVYIMPQSATLYSLNVDYRCPFAESLTLTPIVWPDATWEINPSFLSYEHPWLDAYDRSRNVKKRQWIINQIIQDDTSAHLHYLASDDDDSVEVMLVVSSGTCIDTLRRTIPFSHAVQWAPNVFTPDAGSNNCFTVILNDGVAEEMYVYNRNGLLVNHMKGESPVWDGTRDGVACPQGAYVWVLRYHTNNRPDYHRVLTGTVTLIR